MTPERTRMMAAVLMAAAAADPKEQSGMTHLADWRRRAGITVGEAAKRIGVSTFTYRNWDRGLNWPLSCWLPAIAQAFGCTIEDLYIMPEDWDGFRKKDRK